MCFKTTILIARAHHICQLGNNGRNSIWNNGEIQIRRDVGHLVDERHKKYFSVDGPGPGVFREDFLLFYCHRLTTLDQEKRGVACHKKPGKHCKDWGTTTLALLQHRWRRLWRQRCKGFENFSLHTFIPSRVDIVFTSEKNRLNYLTGGPILNIWPHITWCGLVTKSSHHQN